MSASRAQSAVPVVGSVTNVALDEALNQVKASVRPIGEPTDDDLTAINNKHARTALAREQVYVFESEISNDLTDSFHTRMHPETTQQNYARDFKEGRALLANHETKTGLQALPLGRSFDGKVVKRGKQGDPQDPARTATVIRTYIPRGVRLANGQSTDDLIRGIDTGIYSDVSVHFADGQYECSVCGRDMLRSRDCTHLPGMEYRGEGGIPVRAHAVIKNARAVEHSLVFEGSTPMAMVNKAQDLASRGLLTARVARAFEKMYGFRVRDDASLIDEELELEKIERAAETRAVCPGCGTVLANNNLKQCPNCMKALGPISTGDDPSGPDPDPGQVAQDMAGQYAHADGETRADWDTKYVNDLPDSAFAVILDGGTKDGDGKTVPRSLRKFPHHDASGKLDEPHVRNALSRIPQSPDGGKARAHIEAHAKTLGIGNRAIGGRMDPYVAAFVAVLTAPMTAEERQAAGDGLIAHMTEETLTKDFVEQVATSVVQRAGKTISADTASQIQGALNKLADAQDAYKAAQNALKTLVSMGGMDPSDMVPAPQMKNKTSDDPDASTGQKPKTIGTNPNGPTHGVIDRSAAGDETRAVCVNCGRQNVVGDATNCPDCGNPMRAPSMLTCSGCGKLSPADSPACTNCGAAMKRSEGARAPQQGGTGNDQATFTIPGNVKTKLSMIQGILNTLLGSYDEQDPGQAQTQTGTKGKPGSSGYVGGGPAGPTPATQSTAGAQVSAASPNMPSRTELLQELDQPEFIGLRKFVNVMQDGQRYRKELARELHEWGVRARGAEYARELHERIMPNLSTADLEAMVKDFEAQAYKRFENKEVGDLPEWAKHTLAQRVGRQTVPTDPFKPPIAPQTVEVSNGRKLSAHKVKPLVT